MYKIGDIIKGAPKLVRSVLNKKREYKIKFNKEKNGCWYVDFPNWPFSHDNLAMVSGADKMCELLADGDLFVEVSVIPANKPQELDDYIELTQTEHSLFGGSTYQVKYEPFVNKFKRDSLWICPVTLFVLGRYPKYIYVKRIEENEDNVLTNISDTEVLHYAHKEEDSGIDADYSYFVSHLKDRDIYIKLKNGNVCPPIEVREIDGERIIYDNRYSIDFVSWHDSETEPTEISKEEYESICNQQTDIEEYVARKVKNDETFYISMTAEDGMQLFEFQGSTYKRNVGTVIDEGIAEGKFSDVDLDFVVSWAKRRGGACNILSKSDFEKWWKRRK